MRIFIIVQARMGSTRLPGKIFKEVEGKSLLSYQIERLKRVHHISGIIIATTENPQDDLIVKFCKEAGVLFFRGNEEDVLDRYYRAAKAFSADVIIRITSDCPLIDPEIIDAILNFYIENYPSYDYVSNAIERTFPRGLDVEVFSFACLKKAACEAKLLYEREHVTPYFRFNPDFFRLGNFTQQPNESHHRWTLDTVEDFNLIAKIIQALYPANPYFNQHDILNLIAKNPEWLKINAHVEQKPEFGDK